MRISKKGAARWSLESNALSHSKVLEYIEEEMQARKDKVAVELAAIAEFVKNKQSLPVLAE